MLPYSLINPVFKKNKLWLVMAALSLSISCEKKNADNGDYSEPFKVILATMTGPAKPVALEDERRYIDSSFRQLKNPYTNDVFRYYGLKYLYNMKGTHNVKMALLYADSMLIAAKKSVNNRQYVANYAEANFSLGDAYFGLSQYNNAYQCYYKGYFMGKNNVKNEILSEYTYRMGMVMFKQARYIEAANYFKLSYKQSLSYKDNFGAFNQRQELLDNIGESFKNSGNIDSAEAYFTKTLDFINANTNRFLPHAQLIEIARAVVYGNQGEIALIKGQNQQSEELLQKSISLNLKAGHDYSNAELVEVNLGKLYFNDHKYPEFIALFKNLRNQLDTVKNEEAETNWNLLMSKYYVQTGNLAKALKHLENYNSLKDSINKRSSTLKETDVNQQQANYDKQYQIENLKDNNKAQLTYTYLAGIFALMAAIIVVLIFRNWKKSKKDVCVVSELNKQINLQKNGMEVALNELKVSSQEKDRILRTVAHDLRNPIGGIASLTQVMLEDEYAEDQKELINLIKETSNNSLELINEILEVTDNGVTQLNKEPVEINSLLSRSVELLRFKALEKHQEIKLQLLANAEELLISREKIWRVISNLITNAIKFSPVGGTIYVKVAESQNNLEISVKDAGIGIPEKMKDKVFNTFTEAKRPGTLGEKSFGLGLSISKQIIETHNGKIWFESDGKTGTTFFIHLPRQKEGKHVKRPLEQLEAKEH
jgi:two-component system sensor histidine kinase VicK